MRAVKVYTRVRIAMTPPMGDHRPALRVAIGLAVPGVALLSAGRPDLMIYAVFGAITGMYGRAESRQRRLAHQTQGAVILILGVSIGVALGNSHIAPAVLVLAAVAFAAVGSVTTDFLALKPEGPFYGLFALGAVATVPAGRVPAVRRYSFVLQRLYCASCSGFSTHRVVRGGSHARPFRTAAKC